MLTSKTVFTTVMTLIVGSSLSIALILDQGNDLDAYHVALIVVLSFIGGWIFSLCMWNSRAIRDSAKRMKDASGDR
jgi:hypothetical protein